MIVVNFTHPLTRDQRAQIETMTGQRVVEERQVFCQFDNEQPFAPQVQAYVQEVGLSSEAWQGETILVNLPGFAPAAAIMMAELHGRMGHFPTVLRIRPVAGSTPTAYEAAEVINLQAVRTDARHLRLDSGASQVKAPTQ